MDAGRCPRVCFRLCKITAIFAYGEMLARLYCGGDVPARPATTGKARRPSPLRAVAAGLCLVRGLKADA